MSKNYAKDFINNDFNFNQAAFVKSVYYDLKKDQDINEDLYDGLFAKNDKIKNLVIAHHSDLDGYCSAAVILYELESIYHNKLKWTKDINFSTVSINYEDDLKRKLSKFINEDELDSTEIWFVDFSFSSDENKYYLEKLVFGPYELTPVVVWIDHHVTSVEWRKESDILAKGLPGLVVDYKLSGAALTWLYIRYITDSTYESIPNFLQYVSDYDTWSKHCEDVDSFKSGADYNWPKLQNLIENGMLNREWRYALDWKQSPSVVKRYIIDGDCVKMGIEVANRKMVARTGALYTIYLPWDKETKYGVFVVNGIGNSSVFGDIIDDPHIAFTCLFSYSSKAKKYIYSFYSTKDEYDMSEIAHRLGGGGHRGAAGCQLTFNMFELAKSNKDSDLALNFNDVLVRMNTGG